MRLSDHDDVAVTSELKERVNDCASLIVGDGRVKDGAAVSVGIRSRDFDRDGETE